MTERRATDSAHSSELLGAKVSANVRRGPSKYVLVRPHCVAAVTSVHSALCLHWARLVTKGVPGVCVQKALSRSKVLTDPSPEHACGIGTPSATDVAWLCTFKAVDVVIVGRGTSGRLARSPVIVVQERGSIEGDVCDWDRARDSTVGQGGVVMHERGSSRVSDKVDSLQFRIQRLVVEGSDKAVHDIVR